MLTSSALLLSLVLCQSSAAQRTDRDYDELVGPVRFVRIFDERLPEDRPKGLKSDRQLEKVVAYGPDGRMTEQIEFGSYPQVCMRVRRVYSYDEHGARSETMYWGEAQVGDTLSGAPDKTIISRQVFNYDPTGRWAEIEDYNAGKVYLRTVYKYDENGRVKERLENYAASGGSVCVFKYNASGLVTEETCERSASGITDRTTHTYTYEVDSQGNWVKRTGAFSAIINGKHLNQGGKIAYREIEYYSPGDNQNYKKRAIFDRSNLPGCPPLVIRKSGGVLQQSATKRVVPDYPQEAKEKRVGGSVVVEVSTDEKGRVSSVRTISGPAELRRTAEEAAKQWEFAPTLLSKVPVRVIGTITFNFNR